MAKILAWFGLSIEEKDISYEFNPYISKISKDILYIKGIKGKVILKIFDITGRKIFNLSDFSHGEIKISLKKFKGGIYFINIKGKDKDYKDKFIKN